MYYYRGFKSIYYYELLTLIINYYFNDYFFNCDIFIYCLYVCISYNCVLYCVYGQMSEIKNYYYCYYFYYYYYYTVQITICFTPYIRTVYTTISNTRATFAYYSFCDNLRQ